MKILVIPDSFKGTLKASHLASIIKETLLKINSSLAIDTIPLSDGGDGMLDALKALKKTTLHSLNVRGANLQIKKASYIKKGNQAFIEMAQASGLDTINLEKENAMNTSTLGVGDIVKHAYNSGARHFVIGLGGSATNDGGIGFLHALGYRFLDYEQQDLAPVGKNLIHIDSIDASNAVSLKDATFTLMTDVNNPLLGEKGATYVFGPQKGLSKDEILYLERGLNHYATLLGNVKGKDFTSFKGSGAAGGFAISVNAFLNTTLRSGISYIFDLLNIESAIKHADIIISGEGKFDQQTAYNKAPFEVIKHAKKYGKFIIILAGIVETDFPQLKIDIIRAIHPKNTALNDMLNPCITKENLIQTVNDLAPYFKKKP